MLTCLPNNPLRGPFGPSTLACLLCPLLTSAVRSGSITQSSVLNPGQKGRSPEVSSTAFRTQPPDLQPVPLMDMDFAVECPLVRHRMPSIRFLSIGSYVCSTLLSDPASRRRPCALLSLHLHQVVKRTFTFELSNMLGTHSRGLHRSPYLYRHSCRRPLTPPSLQPSRECERAAPDADLQFGTSTNPPCSRRALSPI